MWSGGVIFPAVVPRCGLITTFAREDVKVGGKEESETEKEMGQQRFTCG